MEALDSFALPHNYQLARRNDEDHSSVRHDTTYTMTAVWETRTEVVVLGGVSCTRNIRCPFHRHREDLPTTKGYLYFRAPRRKSTTLNLPMAPPSIG